MNHGFIPTLSQIYWEDDAEIDLDSVLRLSRTKQMLPNPEDNFYFGISSHPLWLQMELPDSIPSGDWILLANNPSLHRVDLYITDGDSLITHMRSGNGIRRSERAFPHQTVVFPIDPQSDYHYWIRMVAGDELLIPLELIEKESFFLRSEEESSWLGRYYGFMLVLILAGGSFFLLTGNPLFLYSSIYLLSSTLFTMGLDRFGAEWMTPLTQYMFGGEFGLFASMSGSSFLMSFKLHVDQKISKRADVIRRSLILAFLILGGSMLFAPSLPPPFGRETLHVLKIMVWIVFVPTLIWIVSHVVLGFLKSKQTMRFMLLSTFALMIGVGLQLLEFSGIIPRVQPFLNSYVYAGLSGFAFFLFIGLGEKFREIAQQREQALRIMEASSIEVRSLNQQLATANANLEEKVARRTHELTEAKLRAEAGAHAQANFLATMSHEIRTPMNGIIGMADLMTDTSLTEDQQEQLRIIRSSGDSLLRIINDILDFSKIDSGKMELEYIDFSLPMLVNDVVDLLRPKAQDKFLEFGYHISPEVDKFLKGDAVRLKQILINLTNNAIKFTKAGKVNIHIDLVAQSPSEEEGKYWVQVSVQDTGIGIPANKIQDLFQPFQQVDASTTREFGGTGLGLAISKRLCELMQGKIWIDSVEGQGSTFHFTFLTEKGEEQTSKNLPFSAEATQGLLAEQYPLKILVAEDNLVNQKVVRRLLAKMGYEIEIAENGEEAVRYAQSGVYDLIFMDIQMPVMDGLKATRHIQAQMAQAPIIIAMTANAMKSDQEACYAAGMDGYVSKPIKPSSVREVLVEWGQRIRYHL